MKVWVADETLALALRRLPRKLSKCVGQLTESPMGAGWKTAVKSTQDPNQRSAQERQHKTQSLQRKLTRLKPGMKRCAHSPVTVPLGDRWGCHPRLWDTGSKMPTCTPPASEAVRLTQKGLRDPERCAAAKDTGDGSNRPSLCSPPPSKPPGVFSKHRKLLDFYHPGDNDQVRLQKVSIPAWRTYIYFFN